MVTLNGAEVAKLIKDESKREIFVDLIDCLEGPEREVLDYVINLAFKEGQRSSRPVSVDSSTSPDSYRQPGYDLPIPGGEYGNPPEAGGGFNRPFSQGQTSPQFPTNPFQRPAQPQNPFPPTDQSSVGGEQPGFRNPVVAPIPQGYVQPGMFGQPDLGQPTFPQPGQNTFQRPQVFGNPQVQPGGFGQPGLPQGGFQPPPPAQNFGQKQTLFRQPQQSPSLPQQPVQIKFQPRAPALNPIQQGSSDPVRNMVQQIVAKIKSGQVKLPVFPHVAKKVLDMLNDQNLNVQKMSKEMKYDQVLTSKIISISNSAFYGGATQTKTIEAAIVKIGLLEVRKHLYALATQNIYHFESDIFASVIERLSNHTTAAANGAFNMARLLGVEDHEKYLLNTLFHDVGKLWLIMVVSEVLSSHGVYDQEFSFSILRQLVVMAHTQMGGRLTKQWKFDQKFVDNVTNHHMTINPNSRELCIIQFGNNLAKSIGFSVFEDDPWTNELMTLASIFGVSEDNLERMQTELMDFMAVYRS